MDTTVDTKELLFDSHAHLDDPRFDADRDEVIKGLRDGGVGRVMTVGCWNAEEGFGTVPDLINRFDNIYGALGVHPHDALAASEFKGRDPLEVIREMALKDKRIVAIGETGLDYHYKHSPPEVQKEFFRRQIALARELNLPLIVHSREAADDTISILKEEGASDGILHCFSGDRAMAKDALKLGFYLSFSGVITFRNADELVEVVRETPLEKILVETDSPYLAPVPKRGKRNEPAFVAYTAAKIAEIKGLTVEDVARITALNTAGLLGLGGKEERAARIAYKIRNSLYLNITNRCTNHCSFCAKFKSYTVKGHYLRLSEEPDLPEVMKAIGPDPHERFDEIVFCGYGEPLIRIDLVKELGLKLKKMGCKVRIDTDGLANLVHGRNVLPELHFVDTISVSLNAPDSTEYQKIIKTPFGDAAYPAILFFLREAKKHIAKVVATAVSVPGVDMEGCRVVAEDEIGVPFRVREYNQVG